MRSYHKLFPILLFTAAGVSSLFGELDRSRYIPVSEIRTDMEAYCLTVLEGTKVERFELKILSIVHNEEPGQDRILVIGTDERFKHIGAVHGCSGSPVYIDGRMAGALSAGWDGSLDPLYLVTPIEDMLKIRQTETISKSLPLKFSADHFIHPEQFQSLYFSTLEKSMPRDMAVHPLAVSVPAGADNDCMEVLRRVGLMPVFNTGFAGTASDGGASAHTVIESGGILAVPLCMGDINMAAVGTVTEVVDNRVYGFGHSFLGRGGVAMPMSAGAVHTVVTTRQRSFKFATAGPVVGTICQDQASGIHGLLGPVPPMIPMTVKLDRYDMPEPREFRLQIARDEILTSPIIQAATMSAAQMYGAPPPENSIEYSVRVRIKDREPVEFSNISSGSGFSPVVSELFSAVSLLMNNPYETAEIEEVEVAIQMEPRSREAQIWGAALSAVSVKPGETVEADVTLMTYRQEKYTCRVPIQIPSDLPAGRYEVSLFSPADYMAFIRKATQYRYSPDDMDSMIGMINEILNVARNRLIAVINLPEGGIALRRQELPNLPASRAALLQDQRRVLPVSSMSHWIESHQSLPIVPSGSLKIELTVEHP